MGRITKYIDPKGTVHTVRVEYTFGAYIIYLDGQYYSNADDRMELSETIRELVTYKQFSETGTKNISPRKPASRRAR